MNNITSGHFNTFTTFQDALLPYGWGTLGLAFPVFLLLGSLFFSMWVNHGNLRGAATVGLMFCGMFVIGGGLGFSIPYEMFPIIYGVLAASVAGWIMSMFKSV